MSERKNKHVYNSSLEDIQKLKEIAFDIMRANHTWMHVNEIRVNVDNLTLKELESYVKGGTL